MMMMMIVGLLTDLFNCVAQHLAFTDLMVVFFGQPAPLERLRQPLQQFVRHSVLNDAEPTEGNISAASNRLVENIHADIQAACVSNVCLMKSVHSKIQMACVSAVSMFDRSVDSNIYRWPV